MNIKNKNKRIWLKIAKAYETPYEKRSREQVKLTKYGLCYAIRVLAKDFNYYVMLAQFKMEKKNLGYSYLWPVRYYSIVAKSGKRFTERCDLLRAKLARKLAKQLDKVK